MFEQILRVQWKASALPLLPLALLAVALPILMVQGMGQPTELRMTAGAQAGQILWAQSFWSLAFPILAIAIGSLVGLTAWVWDHQGGHVYPLSLPVARWKYALFRMGAGIVILAVASTVFWIGSLVAAQAVDVPDGLRAYPGALALRFFLASLTAYGVLFALASGTVKTTAWTLGGGIALVIALLLVGDDPTLNPFSGGGDPLAVLGDWLTSASGPLRVFSGGWHLFDV